VRATALLRLLAISMAQYFLLILEVTMDGKTLCRGTLMIDSRLWCAEEACGSRCDKVW
jgi:hypothetical protein